jgi:hypothetical protein
MFKVSIIDSVPLSYKVSHYAKGDPQPTNTERIYSSRPDAWRDAFGSAAKMCLMLPKESEQTVIVDDGREFVITCKVKERT